MTKRIAIPATECIEDMQPAKAHIALKALCEKLDDLECDDFFGTEGWRRFLMGQDS